MLHAIWRYRHFIAASIRGEWKGRFARSRLGTLWLVLHPLAQAAIFALILAEVLSTRLPGVANKAGYAVYVMAGMAAWTLFSETLIRSMTVFIEYAGVVKKIAFPRMSLPLIVLGVALVNHVLLLAAIAAVFLLFGYVPGWAWLAFPVGTILISALGLGLGVLLGTFNVFSRDVAQVTGILVQIWFWLTPVVYPREIVPASFAWVIDFNPMTSLVAIYQDGFLYDRWPHVDTLVVPTALALILVVTAFGIFRRASAEMVDAL